MASSAPLSEVARPLHLFAQGAGPKRIRNMARSGTPDRKLATLLGLGLATWMEFYNCDGVNLVLPDVVGTFGVSQDQASC
jgi:hypothetical protein